MLSPSFSIASLSAIVFGERQLFQWFSSTDISHLQTPYKYITATYDTSIQSPIYACKYHILQQPIFGCFDQITERCVAPIYHFFTNIIYLPSFSRTVAYLLFASGHAFLLHIPMTLFSFRQNMPDFVLERMERHVEQ